MFFSTVVCRRVLKKKGAECSQSKPLLFSWRVGPCVWVGALGGWVQQGPVRSRKALVTDWQTGRPEKEGEAAALA